MFDYGGRKCSEPALVDLFVVLRINERLINGLEYSLAAPRTFVSQQLVQFALKLDNLIMTVRLWLSGSATRLGKVSDSVRDSACHRAYQAR